MDDTKPTKRRYFTKAQITRALTALRTLEILEFKEGRCNGYCWPEKKRAKARRFDVTLHDEDLWNCTLQPTAFKLRICNIPSSGHNINTMSVRYYFHLEMDTNTISIEEVSAIVNNWNIEFHPMKTILLNTTEKGYGFCSEMRCNLADVSVILEFHNKYKWILHQAPRNVGSRIEYYLKEKKDQYWIKENVETCEVSNFMNRYTLRNHEGMDIDKQ